MSVLTIGRVGVQVDVDEVRSLGGAGQYGRGQLRLAGTIVGADLAETIGIRNELQAQAETVQWVPVSWTEDTDITGFYRIVGMSYELASLTGKGYVTFDMTFDRLGTVGSVGFQSLIAGALRPNAHSITAGTAYPMFGVPGTHHIVEWPSDSGLSPSSFRSWNSTKPGTSWLVGGADPYSSGDTSCCHWQFTLTSELASGILANPYPIIHVDARPNEFYAQAAELYTDGVLRAGKWIPNIPAAAVLGDEVDFVLSNGIIRVAGQVFSTTANAQVETRIMGPSGDWESATTWEFIRKGGPADFPTFQAIEILSNTPERVSIRLMSPIWTNSRMAFVDLTLKRGVPWLFVNVYTHSLSDLTNGGVQIFSNETGSTAGLTGGIARSTADPDGNKWVLAASGTIYNGPTGTLVFDTTNGGADWEITSAGVGGLSMDFGIGYEINSPAAANSGKALADLLEGYYAPVSQHVKPVLR